ncbi:transporter substrate-binding domain-containing protein [Aureimonas altamirensis]|uniref:transporter substrate-binding domain-containing protein n=1 Tax=Aureimonas altamirensis TaxID=370622 RepID=UPI001E4E2115|nr:transporter substrate-binding domain-containing protein [Aureimonas altamirensis]UHD44524.1 transporter substrate-binding domain-containing protein [Aureimonas altamirensis]
MNMTRRQLGLLIGATGLVLAFPMAGFAAGGTLDKIRAAGTVTVGTEAAFPPFEFVDESGQIVGYGKDILDVVVQELGVKLNQLDLPWQGILPGLLAGNFDFVATTVSINEERARKYAYTAPIANGQPYVLVRKGEATETEDELAGKIVGTQLASSAEPIARALDERLKGAGEGFAELKLYTAYTDCYTALASGEIDAVIQSLPSIAVLVKEHPDTFEVGAPIETGVQWTYQAWVTRPEDADLRDFISQVIYKMRDDGRLYELQDKWFGFRMEIPDEGYLPPDAL